ncbi:MAG: DUF2079 domain-containing protein, partial [Chloroflexi bacterium]|nr:DUF2079 domain-containing protein [Chloroflexota bacterium]
YLHPSLLGVALSEFHEVSLAVPMVALALWALVQLMRADDDANTELLAHDSTVLYVVMWAGLVGALLVKEEFAALIAAVGGLMLLRRQRLMGGALVTLALGWLVFVWGVLPNLLTDAVSHWPERYGDIAPTPLDGARRLLTDPVFLLGRYVSAPKWGAVARVLLPLAFLPPLAPAVFALSLPTFGYLLLSNRASVSQLQFWYVAPLLPIIYVATAAALARMTRPVAAALTTVLLVASAYGYVTNSAGPLGQTFEPARFAEDARTDCGHRLLALIPRDASVSAADNLLPHLAHRGVLNVFPALGDPSAEYVALDTRYEVVGGYSNWPLYKASEVPALL